MKILLVADLHYDLRKFDWVVQAADHVDVVVIAGDHLKDGLNVPLPAQAVVVQRYFQIIRVKRPLLACSGNADIDWRDEAGERVARWLDKGRYLDVAVDGDAKAIGDTLFSVCPWVDGPARQRAVGEQLSFDNTFRPTRWIWVSHAPPRATSISWNGVEDAGDEPLRIRAEEYQPDFVLSGHVHAAPFTEGGSWTDWIGGTAVFNAGHEDGPVPSHIVIDTDLPRAYWVSRAAIETVELAGPPEAPRAIDIVPDWLAAMGSGAARRRA